MPKSKQNPEQTARNNAFKKEVCNLIRISPSVDNTPLKHFLNAVLPEVEETHFIYISNGRDWTNLHYTRSQVIDVLCILAEQKKWTIYYHPAVFTEWIEKKHVIGLSSLVIDIDHIDFGSFTLQTATKEDIENWLIENYNIPKDLLPNFVTMSGHGLHCTYLIDFLTDDTIFTTYIKRLICFFNGDKSSQSINKFYRVPTSANVKDPDNPIRSRVFHINTSENRDIHRLDPLLASEEDTYRYFMTKAQKKYEEKSYDRKNKATASTTTKKAHSNEPYDDFEPIDISHLKPMPYYNGGGTPYNVIMDLHNYVIWSKGECLRNNRNNFIHILASYAVLCNWTQKQTICFCKQYFKKSSSFYNEMLLCINAAYSKEDNPYLYSCTKINEILDMGEYTDIAHCCFTEERKKQQRKEYNHKQYLQRKAKKQNMPSKPKEREIYVSQHFDEDPKILSKDLEVSLSTIYRIRERIIKNSQKANICSV